MNTLVVLQNTLLVLLYTLPHAAQKEHPDFNSVLADTYIHTYDVTSAANTKMLLPPGIRNHGNLCYTSSALHLLSRICLKTPRSCKNAIINNRQVCLSVICSLYDLRQKYLYRPKSSAHSSADLFTSVTCKRNIL